MRIDSKIEITGSPELVKSVFFDFQRWPEWSQKMMTSIWQIEEKPSIEAGDKMAFIMDGKEYPITVRENSEQVFMWRGGIPPWLIGDHGFRFEAGQEPGTTTFTHFEYYSGVIGRWAGYIPLVKGLPPKFVDFNEELKARVESLDKSK